MFHTISQVTPVPVIVHDTSTFLDILQNCYSVFPTIWHAPYPQKIANLDSEAVSAATLNGKYFIFSVPKVWGKHLPLFTQVSHKNMDFRWIGET